MRLNEVHSAVANVCGNNLGIVIAATYLENLIQRNIESTATNLQNVGGLPTSIQGISVGLGGGAGVRVNFVDLGNNIPGITLDPFTIQLPL
jgi:hypothetical protein